MNLFQKQKIKPWLSLANIFYHWIIKYLCHIHTTNANQTKNQYLMSWKSQQSNYNLLQHKQFNSLWVLYHGNNCIWSTSTYCISNVWISKSLWPSIFDYTYCLLMHHILCGNKINIDIDTGSNKKGPLLIFIEYQSPSQWK